MPQGSISKSHEPHSIILSKPLVILTDNGFKGAVERLSVSALTVHFESPFDDDAWRQVKRIEVKMEDSVVALVGYLNPLDEGFRFEVDDNSESSPLTSLIGRIRKDQHIEICRSEDVESSDKFTGFERIHFIPNALPELDLSGLDTKVRFLGRQFALPITISGMTGGIEKGVHINRLLAEAAQYFNIPMGVGSQRIALDDDASSEIFDVKKYAPDIFLIGNLGLAQLRGDDYLERCLRAVEMIQADALAIHLNVLQELIQVEGDRAFAQVEVRLREICRQLPVPVIIKEVGCGISTQTAQRLIDAGVTAIDVGGRGGTSWGYIEGLRSGDTQTQMLASQFRDWGIPTAYSLAAVRQSAPHLPLIATGGIRDGLMVAKAIALGADMAGVGLPLLRAALNGEQALEDTLNGFVRGLQITMMASGCQNLSALGKAICLDEPHKVTFEQLVAAKGMG